jgi:hypothetical protein
MTGRARRSAGRVHPPDGSVAPDGASSRRPFDEPTVDQLLTEPIVQQLMRRDRTDEASIRQLVDQAAAARLALREN